MKFVMLVEGQTEQGSVASFLKKWLDPRLSQPVGIAPGGKFNGYSDLLNNLERKVRLHLEGPNRDEIVAVVALIDLYGPDFYPPEKVTADERIEWGRTHFEGLVKHERFRFFFAVHEFEAWLLSQPEVFPRQVREILESKKQNTKLAHPERVNFDEPPAKYLERIYKQAKRGNYKKTTYGKVLFSQLDPNVAVAKCPYLSQMLNEMLALAKDAGL